MAAQRPSQPTTEPPSRGDRLQNAVLSGVIRTAMALPYPARVVTMGALVRRAIGPLAGYRKRALDNIALIWPELDAAARRRIARSCLDNAGRTLIENYSWAEFGERLADTQARGPGIAAVAEARAAGRPVLFVTGHFGNYEAPRQVLSRMGHTIGGLYRPASNALFNAHYAQTMTRTSGPVFESGHAGTMAFARHLKRGGMGTILFDVRDTRGSRLPFLGQPAWTSLGASTIAARTGALVVPYFGTRLPGGVDFTVDVETPIAPATPEAMTLEMNARLEARIERHPGQWFWVHKRWKGGTKPR